MTDESIESHGGEATREQQPLLTPLLPPGEPAAALDIVTALGLWRRGLVEPGLRPRVLLNMISTVDGRATLDGRSGPLSNRADKALFHALRAVVDGVLVGAGTVSTERYGRLIGNPSVRALRHRHGLQEEPLACVVSSRLPLEGDVPLLADAGARVAILTSADANLTGASAHVEYIRARRGERLDLAMALLELRERFAVELLMCEGGPHLATRLLAEGLLDELFLSVAPSLAGGGDDSDPTHPEALRILAGPELAPPAELDLLGVLQSESELFLRYGIRPRG